MEKHQACKLNVTKIAVVVEKSFANTFKVAKRKLIQQKCDTIIKMGARVIVFIGK